MERRKLFCSVIGDNFEGSVSLSVCHFYRCFLFSFEVAPRGWRNEEIGPHFLILKACRILSFPANPNELYSYAENFLLSCQKNPTITCLKVTNSYVVQGLQRMFRIAFVKYYTGNFFIIVEMVNNSMNPRYHCFIVWWMVLYGRWNLVVLERSISAQRGREGFTTEVFNWLTLCSYWRIRLSYSMCNVSHWGIESQETFSVCVGVARIALAFGIYDANNFWNCCVYCSSR